MTLRSVFMAILIGGAGGAACDWMSSTDHDVKRTRAPDNTAVNDRDREGEKKTPLDQSNSVAAIDISATIRQSVLAQPDLSMYADNVKIITIGSRVTLRGVVKSAGERDRIAQIATQTAGVTAVDNELTVAPAP